MTTNFLENNWCNLKWTKWISFEDISKEVPPSSGFYRVKPVGHQHLVYIGQTGNIKTRATNLRRETYKEEMPFRDPHAGAPCLWAWKDAEDLCFECSVAPSDVTPMERKVIEHFLFWQYRIEYGESPRCSFGRFHKNYKKSTNRSKNIQGNRLPIGHINHAGKNSQPPLLFKGDFLDIDWMGLDWSYPLSLNKLSIKNLDKLPGVYRIFTEDELLYIGETKNFRNRFLDHIKKNWLYPNIYFSISKQKIDIAPHQLKELENDLIAGYYKQVQKSPFFQFKNLKPV